MFRAQVLRRSFSVFNRVPTSRIVQSAARDGHESIQIHRVRIRRPFLSRQRLVGAVAIATATYGLGHYLGLEVEVEEAEQEDKKPGRWKKQVRKEDGALEEVDDKEANKEEDEDQDEEDDEDHDDAILFLPTGFSRAKKRSFYKGSDPEWQEFRKVTQDKARLERIRQQLVDLVRTSCSTPAYVTKIGEIDHKRGRVWVDFKFPDAPPPEFERPGYELTEDLELRKTTRDVAFAHHLRLKKLLWPKAAAGAVYADTKRKATQTWNDFAVYIGWAEKTEHLPVQQMMQQATSPSAPTSSPASSAATASASPLGTSLPAAQQPAAPSPSSTVGSEKELGFPLVDPKLLTLDLGKFRQDFQRGSKPTLVIPRGAFAVYALIEVYGSRARLIMDVIGVYDPKVGRYIGLSANIWNQAALRQGPKGGP